MMVASLSFTNHHHHHHHLHLLLLLILLSTTIISEADETSPAIIRTVCGRNQSRNPQSFDVNFVNVMELIYQNITKSGFGTAVYGASDTVYGLGQCFGYLSPVDCQLCYAQSRVKLPLCLPATSSRIYLDGCFLRYADFNVSDQAVDASDTSVCGNSSVATSTQMQFQDVTNELIKNLTSGAINDTEYYKVGSADVSPGTTVFGMAQCWKSLNASGCRDCLESARESVGRCVPAGDGRALNAGCYVRYSTEPFYLAATSEGGSSHVLRRVGVAVGCAFAALLVVGIAILWMRKRASSGSTDDMDGSAEFIKSISKSHLSFKYEDLRKATDDFNLINKLGQGGFGSVYKGILPDGREVAVKRLFFHTRQWVDQFFNEVTLINQIQHKNLVKLLGCSVEGPESLLVYEYLCNTSLDHFLFDSFKKNALDWKRRLEIVVGTAEGLAYLHNASEVRIIHRDIKASNILLDERFKPKIADFGLARCFPEDKSHVSTALAGTLGYIAPEYVLHGQLTEKADVYSYGILVLEMLTGQKNHSSTAASAAGHSLVAQVWQHFNSRALMEMLDPYLQGQCSEEQTTRVFRVGLLCTQASPNLRPPMWRVVEMLTSGSRDLPLPTRPPFLNTNIIDIRSEGSQASNAASSSSKSPPSVNQLSVSIVQGR